MENTSLVPTVQQTATELEHGSIKSLIPTASKELVTAFVRHNLVGLRLQQAHEICNYYSVRPGNLVKWMDDGLSLNRIKECLEVREVTSILSVSLIGKFLDGIDFQSSLPIDMLDAFNDVVKGLRMKQPWHYLMHRIEEMFNANVLAAYQMCLQDSEHFALVIQCKEDYMDGKCWSINDLLYPEGMEN